MKELKQDAKEFALVFLLLITAGVWFLTGAGLLFLYVAIFEGALWFVPVWASINAALLTYHIKRKYFSK